MMDLRVSDKQIAEAKELINLEREAHENGIPDYKVWQILVSGYSHRILVYLLTQLIGA